jgi:glycosidase
LRGIQSKLDYIQALGADSIWLTPVSPSPSYHKYDVTAYCDIDPGFGTLADTTRWRMTAKRAGSRCFSTW